MVYEVTEDGKLPQPHTVKLTNLTPGLYPHWFSTLTGANVLFWPLKVIEKNKTSGFKLGTCSMASTTSAHKGAERREAQGRIRTGMRKRNDNWWGAQPCPLPAQDHWSGFPPTLTIIWAYSLLETTIQLQIIITSTKPSIAPKQFMRTATRVFITNHSDTCEEQGLHFSTVSSKRVMDLHGAPSWKALQGVKGSSLQPGC